MNRSLDLLKDLKISTFHEVRKIYYKKFIDYIFQRNPYIIYIKTEVIRKDRIQYYFHLEFYEKKSLLWCLSRIEFLKNYFQEKKKAKFVDANIFFPECTHIELKLDDLPYKFKNLKYINKNFVYADNRNLFFLILKEIEHFQKHRKFSRTKISGIVTELNPLFFGDIKLISLYPRDPSKFLERLKKKEVFPIVQKYFNKFYLFKTDFPYIFIDKNKLKTLTFPEIFYFKEDVLQSNYLQIKDTIQKKEKIPPLLRIFGSLERIEKDFYYCLERIYLHYKKHNQPFNWKNTLLFVYKFTFQGSKRRDRYLANLTQRKVFVTDLWSDFQRYLIDFYYHLFAKKISKKEIQQKFYYLITEINDEYHKRIFRASPDKNSELATIRLLPSQKEHALLFLNLYNKVLDIKIKRYLMKYLYNIYKNKNILKDIFDSFFISIKFFEFFIDSFLPTAPLNRLTIDGRKEPISTVTQRFFENPNQNMKNNDTFDFILKYPGESRYLIPGLFLIHTYEIKKLEKLINDKEIKRDILKTLLRFRFTERFHDLLFFIDDIDTLKRLIHLYKQFTPKSQTFAEDLKSFIKLYDICKNKNLDPKILEIIDSIKNLNQIRNKLPLIETILNKKYISKYKKYVINLKDKNEFMEMMLINSLIRHRGIPLVCNNLEKLLNTPSKYLFYEKEITLNSNYKLLFKNFNSIKSILAPEIVDCCATISDKKFWDYFEHPYTYNLMVEKDDEILLWSLLVWAKDENDKIYLVLDNIEVVTRNGTRKELESLFPLITEKIFQYLDWIGDENVVKNKFFIGKLYNDINFSRYAIEVDNNLKPLKHLYYSDAFDLGTIYKVKR